MAERQRQQIIDSILNIRGEDSLGVRAFLEMLSIEELEDLHVELAMED